MLRVVIIGGGAAGLCAGVLLARAQLAVTILEKTENCGKKLSMTGNGRCNLSNLRMDASFFNEEARTLLTRLLARYGVREAEDFFASCGVLLREEEGLLYPVSGQAQSVTDALVNAYLAAGGKLLTRRQVKAIVSGAPDTGHAWSVRTAGEQYDADAVLLACGARSGPKSVKATGDGYYIAETLGAALTPTYPALCGLKSAAVTLPEKTGVRVRARVSCYADDGALAREEGEVQLTRGRISGIPVMQASARCAKALDAGKALSVSLDLFPETDDAHFAEAVEGRIRRLRAEAGAEPSPVYSLGAFLTGFANSAVNELVCARFALPPDTDARGLPEETLRRLLYAYRDLRFAAEATDGYAHAQATAGGIALSSLTENLSLTTAPGVYCIGEIVDVCGRCGGYNLQWAWTSAMCAADAVIAQAL